MPTTLEMNINKCSTCHVRSLCWVSQQRGECCEVILLCGRGHLDHSGCYLLPEGPARSGVMGAGRWLEASLRPASAPRVSVCLLLKGRVLTQKDQQLASLWSWRTGL